MTRGCGLWDKKTLDIGRRQENQPSGKNHKKVKLNLQTSKAPECIPVSYTKSSKTGVLNEGPGSLRKLTILYRTTSGNDCDILEPFARKAVISIS